MAETLRPYTDFDAEELGAALHDLVAANKRILVARNLLGPIRRYGGEVSVAIGTVEKGQGDHAAGRSGHYVVTNESGGVIGAASVADLSLRRLQLPLLPPGMARGPLRGQALPRATHNVAAWVDRRIEYPGFYLGRAYQALGEITGTAEDPDRYSWTLEPVRPYIYTHHLAVQAGKLGFVAIGRFDDQETRWGFPHRSVLYADIVDAPGGDYSDRERLQLLALPLPSEDAA